MLKYTVITVLGLVGGVPWGGDRGYVLRIRIARFLVSYKSLASYSRVSAACSAGAIAFSEEQRSRT